MSGASWTSTRRPHSLMRLIWFLPLALGISPAFADETCQSPFLPKVTGQEDYIYVWTLGVKGVGGGNDSLVTVDANPQSKTYGQIIHRRSEERRVGKECRL